MGESKQQSEPQYLNEFHEKTTEDKIKHLQSLNPSEIDWEKELKQQKLNAHDDLPQKIIGSHEKNQGGMLRSQKLKAKAFKNVQERPKQQQSEPQYLTEAHKKSSEAKQATIKKWQESPTDWEKIDKLTQEHFNQHGQKNPNKKSNQIDRANNLTETQRAKIQAHLNLTKKQQKPLKLTPAMRAGLRAKIADRVKKDPEFKKRVLDDIEAKLKDPASNLTETQRAMAQEYLNKNKSQQQSKHQYLTEAHRKNSEAAMKYLNSLDPSKIDWEKEIERQKRNARD